MAVNGLIPAGRWYHLASTGGAPPGPLGSAGSLKAERGTADFDPMSLELVALMGALPIAFTGIRIVQESERLVVIRLGRVFTVLRPGLHWIIPIVDRTVRVEPSKIIADWAHLSPADLDQRLIQLARSGQLPG